MSRKTADAPNEAEKKRTLKAAEKNFPSEAQFDKGYPLCYV